MTTGNGGDISLVDGVLTIQGANSPTDITPATSVVINGGIGGTTGGNVEINAGTGIVDGKILLNQGIVNVTELSPSMLIATNADNDLVSIVSPAGGGLINIQRFFTSGTYTPTIGASTAWVRMIAGGGGGSGSGVAASAGGTGGSTNFDTTSVSGGEGGNLTLGIDAQGGAGGETSSGSASFFIEGNDGTNGAAGSGGNGGSSAFGGGSGSGGYNGAAHAGRPGHAYGAGGGGAGATSAGAGGGGGSGMYAEIYLPTLSVTSFNIGAGGGGGNAGTGGAAGGSGFHGAIVVYEFG